MSIMRTMRMIRRLRTIQPDDGFSSKVFLMNVKLLDLQAQYLPIRNEIRRAMDEVCDSQSLILGPHVERFEKSLAEYCGTRHVIGVSSGTDALLCTMMATGI